VVAALASWHESPPDSRRLSLDEAQDRGQLARQGSGGGGGPWRGGAGHAKGRRTESDDLAAAADAGRAPGAGWQGQGRRQAPGFPPLPRTSSRELGAAGSYGSGSSSRGLGAADAVLPAPPRYGGGAMKPLVAPAPQQQQQHYSGSLDSADLASSAGGLGADSGAALAAAAAAAAPVGQAPARQLDYDAGGARSGAAALLGDRAAVSAAARVVVKQTLARLNAGGAGAGTLGGGGYGGCGGPGAAPQAAADDGPSSDDNPFVQQQQQQQPRQQQPRQPRQQQAQQQWPQGSLQGSEEEDNPFRGAEEGQGVGQGVGQYERYGGRAARWGPSAGR
jgi:hypothetical protein